MPMMFISQGGYGCQLCELTFNSQNTLAVHMRRKHNTSLTLSLHSQAAAATGGGIISGSGGGGIISGSGGDGGDTAGTIWS
jgi:hypothetical protein